MNFAQLNILIFGSCCALNMQYLSGGISLSVKMKYLKRELINYGGLVSPSRRNSISAHKLQSRQGQRVWHLHHLPPWGAARHNMYLLCFLNRGLQTFSLYAVDYWWDREVHHLELITLIRDMPPSVTSKRAVRILVGAIFLHVVAALICNLVSRWFLEKRNLIYNKYW